MTAGAQEIREVYKKSKSMWNCQEARILNEL